ncbi:MAG: TAXI family TRAP transporter solute-binding subunit, partial [Ectothiorhodospiraceae bacterium]|nr:TAXI family TRAP transporter solute-binding subunit [Ectothiorhodospiraceae bacterium]
DIRLISFTDEEIEKAAEVEPVFAPYTLRAGMYDGVDEEVQTISIPNVLVVNSDMDEELAYQITKVMFERVEDLIAIHPAANDTTVDFSLTSTPVPLHPGAIRYYEEIGEDIPDNLRP